MIYVKESLFYKRRYDLEPRNTECIWIEIQLNHTRVLFGLFYRPPNSNAAYLASIEDSISLALDTQINNIIVTGDFNLDMLNNNTSRKVSELCEQFSLYQTITEPTHFTENSSSLIDIILTSDKSNLIYSGVAEPFLHQVSLENLYSETGWDTLDMRRKKQKRTLFYKIAHNLTPHYLTSLIPSSVTETSSYNLRNSNGIRTVRARTSQYFSSFLPSTIREWNNLPEEQRYSPTIASFKYQLNQPNSFTPKYFYIGERQAQILHTRLRTKCSSLNHDIFLKNLTDSPLCRCGSIENAEHYLLQCILYRQQRIEMLNSVSQLCHVTLDVLLSGDSSLSIDTNSKIFLSVHTFIKSSKRF